MRWREVDEPMSRVIRLRTEIQKKFRQKRMARFQSMFHVNGQTSVLDVGGTCFNWSLLPTRPRLTIANIARPTERLPDNVSWVLADATNLPFRDSVFDVVYSNSVIEHLSSEGNQRLMAQEIQRLGDRYYVQTPNQGFPVEPHFLTPLIHFVPRRWRHLLLRNFTVWGWLVRPDREWCKQRVQEIRLLRRREVQRLFPDARIEAERFVGFVKSWMAVRR